LRGYPGLRREKKEERREKREERRGEERRGEGACASDVLFPQIIEHNVFFEILKK